MTATVSVGTIPNAPKFPVEQDLSTFTPFFSKVTTDFKIIDRINMYVVGQQYQTPQVGNYKLLNDWFSVNMRNIQLANIYDQL